MHAANSIHMVDGWGGGWLVVVLCIEPGNGVNVCQLVSLDSAAALSERRI